MKYVFMMLIFLFNTSYADPFYKENGLNSDGSSLPDVAENRVKTTACMPTEIYETLVLDSRFEQLKFIGIIQKEKVAKALFLDAEQQVIDLKQEILIFPSMIEIKQINLKEIKYIDWANSTDCLNPILVTKKL